MNTLMSTDGLLLVAALFSQGAWFWWAARTMASHRRLEERVAHLSDAVALLTETAETGFRASATELARLAELQAAPSRIGITRRVKQAVTAGRRVAEVAVDERISEGEARLRLHLDDVDEPVSRIPQGEKRYGALRA